MPKPKAVQEEFLSTELAAKRLNVKPRRLRELAADGRLERVPSIDPQSRRQVVVYRAEQVNKLAQDWLVKTGERVKTQFRPGGIPAVGTATEQIGALAAVGTAAEVPPKVRLWLTVAEAAQYSGLAEGTILRLIREGNLPALDQHVRGDKWRIRKQALDEFDGTIGTKAAKRQR